MKLDFYDDINPATKSNRHKININNKPTFKIIITRKKSIRSREARGQLIIFISRQIYFFVHSPSITNSVNKLLEYFTWACCKYSSS